MLSPDSRRMFRPSVPLAGALHDSTPGPRRPTQAFQATPSLAGMLMVSFAIPTLPTTLRPAPMRFAAASQAKGRQ